MDIMMKLLFGICCCLASLTRATWSSDISGRVLNEPGYAHLVSRADSRSPSPAKPESRSRSKSPTVKVPARFDFSAASSSKQRSLSRSPSPLHEDDIAASFSQVMMRPVTSQPHGNLMQIGGKKLGSIKEYRQSYRTKRIDRPSREQLLSVEAPRSNTPDSTMAIDPAHLTGIVKGKQTALAIADGPAYIEAGVLGKPSTGRVIRPGRTGVLSIAHDSETVWATGNAGKGARAIAAATGDGVTVQSLASYEGKGWMKTYGPDDHDTFTKINPGKKDEAQYEVTDPSKTNMGATVGIDGAGQATAGGLSSKHTSTGKDYEPRVPMP